MSREKVPPQVDRAPAIVEYVPKAGAPAGIDLAEHEQLREALNRGAHESAHDALLLAGSPELLERLDGYPPDHPYRAGIRWRVYEVQGFKAARFVPVDWQGLGLIPTERALAALIVQGRGDPRAPRAGRYLVRGFLGHRALPKIELEIGTPIELVEAAATGGGAPDRAFDLLERTLPALGAGRAAEAEASQRIEDIEASVIRQAAAIEKLAAEVRETSAFVARAAQMLGQASEHGGMLQLAREFKDVFLTRPEPAPAAPAAPAGRGVVQ